MENNNSKHSVEHKLQLNLNNRVMDWRYETYIEMMLSLLKVLIIGLNCLQTQYFYNQHLFLKINWIESSITLFYNPHSITLYLVTYFLFIFICIFVVFKFVLFNAFILLYQFRITPFVVITK